MTCDLLLWVIVPCSCKRIKYESSSHKPTYVDPLAQLSRAPHRMAGVDGSSSPWLGGRPQMGFPVQVSRSLHVFIVLLLLPCPALTALARGWCLLVLMLPWQWAGWRAGATVFPCPSEQGWPGGRLCLSSTEVTNGPPCFVPVTMSLFTAMQVRKTKALGRQGHEQGQLLTFCTCSPEFMWLS